LGPELPAILPVHRGARRPVRVLPDQPALEQPPPLGPDRVGVPEELLVHRLGEPGVDGLEEIRIHGCSTKKTRAAPGVRSPGIGSGLPGKNNYGSSGRAPSSRARSSATRRAAAAPWSRVS